MTPARPGPFDPATGRVHVLAAKCATCVFRAGNLAQIRPGRLKSMIRWAVAKGSAIVCHSTVGTDAQAVCRGFFDAHITPPLLVAAVLGVVVYDPPPAKDQA